LTLLVAFLVVAITRFVIIFLSLIQIQNILFSVIFLKYGQIGLASANGQYLNLVQIPIVGSAVSASAGDLDSFVLTNNSQVYGFGYNYVSPESSTLCLFEFIF